nr:M4 family metallopeptidase [Oceanococcus sp. HetDA_MAG_MS8]
MPTYRMARALLCASALAATVPVAAQDTARSRALTDLLNHTQQQLQWQVSPNRPHSILRALGDFPLLVDAVDAAPFTRATSFLNQFSSLWGLEDAAEEFALARISQDRSGRTHVHLDQTHAGIPVFGARLVVHMDDAGIQGVSGSYMADLPAADARQSLSPAELQKRAMQAVQKAHPRSQLHIQDAGPLYYTIGLLEGFGGPTILAYSVGISSQAGDVREQVILDHSNGALINRINNIHTQLNREIYTPNQDVPALLTEGSALAPADIPLAGDVSSDPLSRIPKLPTDNLYIFAGGTYDLYRNLFGREGYDEGAVDPAEQVQKSVYLINENCPNAYWNGDSTNYCPGFDTDDVVSHEWSHAYTEFTHGLIYQYQSGALNEAYSDIFGEMYDLVNGIEGPLGVTLLEGEYFENGGSRWVLGEDLSELAAGLLLRDMWDPDNFGANVPILGIPILSTPSPGSVISSENYFCGTGDGGGVHTNSGVPNHAFAMLVDGKSFNGVDIPAIGMTRAAHIYFHAMVNYQIPSTNFADHADALAQSCLDLLDVPLNDVLGNASEERITPQTCAAVEAAMTAVEMRQDPTVKCNYKPLLQPEAETPPVCAAGEAEVVSFEEGFAGTSLPAGWSATLNQTGDSNEGINWVVTDDIPQPHTGQAAFIANTFGGSCAPGGDISASFQLDSADIAITAEQSVLSINQFIQTEAEFDGGNLKYSLNGADFALVPAEAFLWNAYNMTLTDATAGGNTNPIAGQPAWSGSDQGESKSSWGTSQISLDALGAKAGDSLRLRFEFGQDGCNGNLGWYVDHVQLSHCTTASRQQPNTASSRGAFSQGGAMGYALLALGLLALRRRRMLAA